MTVPLRLAAAALAISLAAGPTVLDACLITCHATTAPASDQSGPSCHHDTAAVRVVVDSPPSARVDAPAPPCGHDHGLKLSTLTSSERLDAGRCALGFGVSPASIDPTSIGRHVVAPSLASSFAPGRLTTHSPLRI
jgi:hypothetical protein